MFWKRKEAKEGEVKLPKPKRIPDLVGRYMVIEEKKDPDWVWQLKAVLWPGRSKHEFYCRVFSESQTEQEGVEIRNWTSLDDKPHLVIWEGFVDKEKYTVRREKFEKHPPATH